mmetsp:Transcript_15980/g.22838  ORF Transcript_15980/g.22838 Transcript_15980/m.22838 type:complete len:313 (-) Transcript_15980:288-1226(-)
MYLRAMSSSASSIKNSDDCSNTPSSDRFKGIAGPNNSSKRNQYSLRAIGIMFLIIYGMLTTLYFLSSQSIMTFQKKAQQQQQQLLRKKNKQLSAEIIYKHDIVRKGGKTATKAIPLKTTKRNVDSSHNTNFKAAVMREFATDDTTTTGNTLVDKKTTFASFDAVIANNNNKRDDDDDDVISQIDDTLQHQPPQSIIKIIPPQPADLFDDDEETDKKDAYSISVTNAIKDGSEEARIISNNEFGLVTAKQETNARANTTTHFYSNITTTDSEIVIIRDASSISTSQQQQQQKQELTSQIRSSAKKKIKKPLHV